jgi:hypothetical protein
MAKPSQGGNMKDLKFNLQLFSEEETPEVETETVEQEVDNFQDALDSFNDDLDTPVEEDTTVEDDTPVVEETEEEVKEESVEENEESEETADADEELYTLKHFEGDKQVTMKEMQDLAQMGMDRERILTQRDEARNDPRLQTADKIEQLSKLYDYEDLNKFVEDLYAGYDTSKADKEGLTPEMVKQQRINDEKEKSLQAKEEALKSETKIQDENARFVEKYPDVKPSDIPEQVWTDVNKGVDLTEAYDNYINASKESETMAELEKLKEEIAILRKNAENKSKVKSGSLEGKTDGKTEEGYLTIWDKE